MNIIDKMPHQYNNTKSKAKKKLLRKILKVERFSYSATEGRLVLDKTGSCCFIGDIIRIIEKEEWIYD